MESNIALADVPPASTKSHLELAALLISAVCTLCILGWLMWFVRFGIDFADEGYYLNWISDPTKYKASTSQFGYIYHPLYALLSGDISAIRQANILITFFLAWILSFVFLKVLYGTPILDIHVRLVASAAIAISSLCFYRNWIPTPNYNFLTFQALMLVTIGLILAERDQTLKSLFGWILLGFGWWLAFMAKPTSAATAGLISIVYLIFAGKRNKIGFSISVGVVILALILFAFAVDGSINGFLVRLREGVRLAQVAVPVYGLESLIRIDGFRLKTSEWLVLLFAWAVLSLLLSLANSKMHVISVVWFTVFFCVAVFVFWLTCVVNHSVLVNRLWVHLIVFFMPLGALLTGIFITRQRDYLLQHIRAGWPLLCVLLIMPWLFAFGTGGNYWFYYGLVSIFWILLGLFFIVPVNGAGTSYPLLSYVIVVQAVVPLVVLVAIEDPYYQPSSLRKSNFEIEVGRPGASLKIPPSFGEYLSQAVKVARDGGFKAGTPMIDLTGRSPGLLYGIGASSTGYPWIYGNYSNSNNNADVLAVEILKGVSCEEIAAAWLLIEPNGPVSISSSVLGHFGADVTNDYQVVGAMLTVSSLGGFLVTHNQLMLKPTRVQSEASERCHSTKALLEN